MQRVIMFLHGQGVDADRTQEYLKLISSVSQDQFLPLNYGSIIQNAGLTTLSRTGKEKFPDDDQELLYAEATVNGAVAADLGLDGSISGVTPEGKQAKSSAEFAATVISYSVRYLARRQIHKMVLDEVFKQSTDYIQKKSLQRNSVVLMAHSLGTVVGLDLLHSEIGDYFYKYLSLGSPLGRIANVYLAGQKLLPLRLRKIKAEWTDVAAPDDRIVKHRVGPNLGFDGKPLQVVDIQRGYDRPHSAYFFNETALSEWIAHLADA